MPWTDEKWSSVFNRRAREWNGLMTARSDSPQIAIEQWDHGGSHVTKIYELVCVIEETTNCFCCSCSRDGYHDPFCRNHGWLAQRPCEEHAMPGQMHHPKDYDNEGGPHIPDSVQAHKRRFDKQ